MVTTIKRHHAETRKQVRNQLMWLQENDLDGCRLGSDFKMSIKGALAVRIMQNPDELWNQVTKVFNEGEYTVRWFLRLVLIELDKIDFDFELTGFRENG